MQKIIISIFLNMRTTTLDTQGIFIMNWIEALIHKKFTLHSNIRILKKENVHQSGGNSFEVKESFVDLSFVNKFNCFFQKRRMGLIRVIRILKCH